MTILDRVAARIDRFFGYGKPEHPTLNCGCARADSVIVGCLHCDHATCDQHRTEHDCTTQPEGVLP